MTRIRAAVVRKEALVEVAGTLGVGDALRLGRGEERSEGRQKAGILADAVEALIGAVYEDGGWKAAKRLVMDHWRQMIEERAAAPDARDAKTQLQERLAGEGKAPEYRVHPEGPGHARRFRVEVWVGGKRWGEGEGSSRRSADQRAAADALERLYPEEREPDHPPRPRVAAPPFSPPSPVAERVRRWSIRRAGRKS